MDISHVDYMSVDAEGFEPAILQSFPWDSVTVDLIQLERIQNAYLNVANIKFFKEFLEKRGFEEQSSLCIDMLFRRTSSGLPNLNNGFKFGDDPRAQVKLCPNRAYWA